MTELWPNYPYDCTDCGGTGLVACFQCRFMVFDECGNCRLKMLRCRKCYGEGTLASRYDTGKPYSHGRRRNPQSRDWPS